MINVYWIDYKLMTYDLFFRLKMQVMRLEEDNKQYEGKLKRAVLNGEGGDGESYKQIQV